MIGIVVWQSTKDRVGTEILALVNHQMPSETSHEDSGASSKHSGGIGAMTDDVYVEIVANSYYMQTDI